MARPTKNIEDKRDELIRVRLTTAERIKLETAARAYGLTLSEFLRRRALSHRLPRLSSDQLLITKLTNAFIRLGVNLNQIARVANIKDKVLVNMLYELIVRIDEKMDELDESN